MKKSFTTAIAVLAAFGTVAGAVPASAQSRNRDSDRDGRSDRQEWNRDRDRDGRPDQYDRRDNRRPQQWRYYGGNYGYNGYAGAWRTGQRYTNWRDNRYVVNNWRAYNLPPPRAGYRYYRDRNGDVVMAAIATGVIGLIIGGALSGR
jgi:Ni/Co efflux regulator RcnB